MDKILAVALSEGELRILRKQLDEKLEEIAKRYQEYDELGLVTGLVDEDTLLTETTPIRTIIDIIDDLLDAESRADLKEKIESLVEENQNLQDMCDDYKTKLSNAWYSLDNVREHLDELETRLNDSLSDLDDATSDLDDAISECDYE